LLENGYLLLARDRKDTPPDTHSAEFTQIGYGLQVYMKTAMCLYWLEQAVGTNKFDAAMQDYYQKWQFRHPYPEDFKAVLQSNDVSADWFFQAMQTQKQADYALKNVKQLPDGKWELEVKEKGGLPSPISISAVKDGKVTASKWYWDFVGQADPSTKKKLVLEAGDADAFVIDREHVMLDVNRKNNQRRTSGVLPGMELWQLRSPCYISTGKTQYHRGFALVRLEQCR
jgi:aminopeptidase N